MADVIVPITGWGRGAWGDLGWGANNFPQLAGAVGSVTVVAKANAPVTGLSATASVGSVTVVAEANAPVTGVKERVKLALPQWLPQQTSRLRAWKELGPLAQQQSARVQMHL